MSITAEYAKENEKKPAVLCCRAEEGTVLSEHNLEDPAIFDDLEESGLLNLKGALCIGQVLGAKLTKTSDSLTPVTADLIDAPIEMEEKAVTEKQVEKKDNEVKSVPVRSKANGVLKLHIGEL